MEKNFLDRKLMGLVAGRDVLVTVIAVIVMAVVAWAFFHPSDVRGDVLAQHDTLQGIANGQEGILYEQQTGEITRWTDALFGGMPTFQIRPTYDSSSWLSLVGKVLTLGFPAPVSYLFLLMMGFYLLARSLRLRWHYALMGALAYAFSTYFVILIGAGHIWKLLTLCYIPPTLAGIVWAYRGRYLWGGGLAALMAAMQLHNNHVQMTYYSLVLIVSLALAFLVTAVRQKQLSRWCKATAMLTVAAALAVAANLPNLYLTALYTPETIRGGHSELVAEGASSDDGLDKDYITAWSYGIDETLTLLVPNAKGGATLRPEGGGNKILTLDAVKGADKALAEVTGDVQMRSALRGQLLNQLPQYFGDQPMTNGPVYVGAIIVALFLLGCVVVGGPLKWALLLSTIVSVLLAWGHNAMWLTDFLIDHMPMYNKFRSPSSALIVAEIAMPALALLGLRELIAQPGRRVSLGGKKFTVGVTALATTGLTALVCLVIALWPGVVGLWNGGETDRQLLEMSRETPEVAAAVEAVRASMVSADAWRSFFFLVVALVPMTLTVLGKLRGRYTVAALAVLTLLDLYPVCHRYVNEDSFVPAASQRQQLAMRPADKQILADTASHYRVMDYQHFAEAMPSYYHKTVGGYHAAKLKRYNDLIEHQIVKGNMGVLNMLNTKYFILDDNTVRQNGDALGNAWLVDSVVVVKGANAEMAALDSLDVRHVAVADSAFASLAAAVRPVERGDTVRLTSYAPNRLSYRLHSARGGVAVFSEVYFPWGWTATIDGKPADIGRVNYVLRAMAVPAGDHTVVMEFKPAAVKITTNIATTAIIVIFLLLLGALNHSVWVRRRSA